MPESIQGTIAQHPLNASDPETRLRARLDAAISRKREADSLYTTARNNLRVFLESEGRADEPEPDWDTGANGKDIYNPRGCHA